MDLESLGTAAVGLGILSAGIFNGVQTVRTRRLTQALTRPVEETHRQVSVNRHVSNPPTLLDKVDKVQAEQVRVARELRAAGRMFDGHMTASAEDRAELWRAVHGLQRIVGTDDDDDERRDDEQTHP